MIVLDDLFGFGVRNQSNAAYWQQYAACNHPSAAQQMAAMQNAYTPPRPRLHAIDPKTPMTDKAAKLFQVSGLLRDA